MERANLYERLLAHCCEEGKRPEDGDPRQAATNLPEIKRALVLHGSAKVLAAYNNLRRSRGRDGQPAEEINVMLSKLVVEIRKDLGHSDLIRNDKDILDLLSG